MSYTSNMKIVLITTLSIGDVFQGIHYPSGQIRWGPVYIITSINENSIGCEEGWHHTTEYFPLDVKVEVEMEEEEIHARDFNKAKEIAQAMEHEMYDQGEATHEMWNGWIDSDPYDMARRARDSQVFIRGWFKLQNPRTYGMDYMLDIGIVAEDDCGNVFWCHADSTWFEHWKERYPELYEED